MKKYISTDRASQLTGYSVDYIGQLCRNSKLSCTLIDGEWAVDIAGMKDYVLSRGEKELDVSQEKTFSISEDANDQSIIVDGKKYITTLRAAQMSSYAQDYIGQLVRGKKIESIQIRGRWFVLLDSLTAYIAEQKRIAAMQVVHRVGFVAPDLSVSKKIPVHFISPIQYTPDSSAVLPPLDEKKETGTVHTQINTSTSQQVKGRIYNTSIGDYSQGKKALDNDFLTEKEVSAAQSGFVHNNLVENSIFMPPPVAQKSNESPVLMGLVGVAVFAVMFFVGAFLVTPKQTLAEIPFVQSLLSMTTASTLIYEK